MVDEPQGAYYGGQVAAPVFRSIMVDALRALGVPPDCPPGVRPPVEVVPAAREVRMPELVGLDVAEAARAAGAAGLFLRVEGAGGRVLRQVPPPGAPVVAWSTVLGYTDPAGEVPGTSVRVPELQGLDLAQAAAVLGPLGLQLEAEGTGRVVAQAPPPGTPLEPGDVVRVRLVPGP